MPSISWQRKRLKFCASYNDEVLPENTDDFKQIDYIEISDVSLLAGIERATPMLFHQAPSRARRKVQTGDVLISTVRTYLKAIAAVEAASDDLIASTGFCVVRPSCELHPTFAGWVAKSAEFVDEVVARSVGVSYPAINASQLVDISIPLPPLDSQKRIAAFLDEKTAQIDGLIARKQALLECLAEKRQAIITQAVTKGLNPAAPMKDSGIDWLGQIPAHWEVKRLDRLNDYRRPIRYGIVLPGPHFEGGVPIIKGGDVRPGRLQRELLNCTDPEIDTANPRARVAAGDLVYTIRGSFGDVEVIAPELAGCNLTQDAARISPLPIVSAEWLVMALKSSVVRGNLEAGALGATIKGINIFDLRRALLPAPPHDEQIEMAAYLAKWRDDLDRLITKVATSIDRLTEYRAALITAAVTGQIEGVR